MIKKLIFTSLFITTILNAGWNPIGNNNKTIIAKSNKAITELKKMNPKLQTYFDKAYAYAIYPNVGKGGFGIGGAFGEGTVFKNNTLYGFSKLSQLTIGFQFGGQIYKEIIFFKDKKALDRFTEGNFELGVQASAVVLDIGKSFNIEYSNGIAIFTVAKGGLMYEATIGGQKFTFEKKEKE